MPTTVTPAPASQPASQPASRFFLPPLFHVRGYTAHDPLDRIPSGAAQMLFVAFFVGIVAALFNWIQGPVLDCVRFRAGFFWWGVLLMTLAYTLMLAPLRKSSSLVFYALTLASAVPLELYLQGFVRSANPPGTACWDYNTANFPGFISVLPLRFLVAWSVDGLVLGTLPLWLARMFAQMLFPAPANEPTFEQQRNFFRDEWSNEIVPKPRRDWQFVVLRGLGIGYFAYMMLLVLGFLGIAAWETIPESASMLTMAFENPALLVNTLCKIALMVMLVFIAAFNVNLRWHSVLVACAAHVVSTAASLGFYFFTSVANATPAAAANHAFLLVSGIVDGVMVAAFLVLMAQNRQSRDFIRSRPDIPLSYSAPELIARWTYRVLAGALALAFAGVLVLRFAPHFDSVDFVDSVDSVSHLVSHLLGASTNTTLATLTTIAAGPDAMLANTLTMLAALSALFGLIARRAALRQHFSTVIAVGVGILAVVALLWGLFSDPTVRSLNGAPLPVPVSLDAYFLAFALVCIALVVVLGALRKAVFDVDFVIASLSPSSAQNVMALDAAFFDDSQENQTATLRQLDAYIAGLTGRKRGLLNFPFWLLEHVVTALYGLRPALSAMSRDEAAWFLRQRLLRRPTERMQATVPLVADAMYQIGMASYALISNAHHAVLNNRTDLGFVPANARDRLQGDYAAVPAPFAAVAPLPSSVDDPANNKPSTISTTPEGASTLVSPPASPKILPLVAPRVATPLEHPTVPDEVDYLIVGSGAGGATMAYHLAQKLSAGGRLKESIVVIESGMRYSPLQDMNDNELEMLRKTYKEGGLQLTKNFDMVIMQGEAVGGTTVVNNAVCFQAPESVQAAWEAEFGLTFGANNEHLARAYAGVQHDLEIHELASTGINQILLNKFQSGVQGFNQTQPASEQLQLKPLLVNYRNDLGDGLWNLGNQYMRKRSMLETYIPWAEARGVRFVPAYTVVQLLKDESHSPASPVKINRVVVASGTGDVKIVTVRKAVVLSGGVVASSQLLLQSGISAGGNVGKHVSCNFAFPTAFEFNDDIRAFDGTQITYAAHDPHERAIFETYFNPPMAFAVTVPFQFDRRASVMARYSQMMNLGALVGSEPNGVVQPTPTIFNGRPVAWTLGDRDREHIRYALSTLLRIGLGAGATRAVVASRPGIELPMTTHAIEEFERALSTYPLRVADMFFATAHPQGGNRMAADGSKQASTRVVNERFQVEGTANVFVADGSVFPTSITVNPQWTIMALSALAAEHVAQA
jgi:choline dehydrogenase-like flavoprotein